MASLTSDRNTPERTGESFAFPAKANTTIFRGSLVALEAGYVVPGHTATGLVAVGRAEQVVEDQFGVAQVVARRGVFRFGNLSGDVVTQAEVGADCYIVDDQTVAKTDGGGTRSRAGKVVAVELLGVWVQTGLGY
ncbi:MAG: hypothetical protein PHW25_01010 [Zoogloea sp.]|uniref:hypothetical protein n=1 Tax=Zoogloea sp. TaxID=49181 RepID=UPI00261D7E78|nr:hypothetical protein [Zoogloea sp.]MDD3325646.1 hypothetical protein [Zoogloea sp.]